MRNVINSCVILFVDLMETVAIAFSVWLVLYLFFITPTQIQGASMEPNFHNNECVVTDKISYRVSEPKRGDVIALHAPDGAMCPQGQNCDFFKRIIGLPGETIEVKEGSFFIDGKRLIEQYLPDGATTLPGNFIKDQAYTLAEDEYFVAGDNREHSSDSRSWGPITKEDIVGRAVFQYCPVDNIGPVDTSTLRQH